MEEEGRQLFLQGRKLRAQRRYAKAKQCFEQAASKGDPDACWEMYSFVRERLFTKQDFCSLLSKGVNNGSQLCDVEMHYFFRENRRFANYTSPSALALQHFYRREKDDSDFNLVKMWCTDPTSQDDPWLFLICARILIRIDHLTEAKPLLLIAARLGLSEAQLRYYASPYNDRTFLKDTVKQNNVHGARYLLDQPDLSSFATAEEIAEAAVVGLIHEKFPSLHQTMTLDKLLGQNCHGLDEATLREIRCRIGAHNHRRLKARGIHIIADFNGSARSEGWKCHATYIAYCKKALDASVAVLAMGKHFRQWVAKDVWKMIARMVNNPLKHF
jgi:hypothetical protein